MKTWGRVHARYNSGGSYRAYIPGLERTFATRDVAFIENCITQIERYRLLRHTKKK